MFSTRIGSFKWSDFLRPFKSTKEKHVEEENQCVKEKVKPMFGEKFTTVLEYPYDDRHYEIMEWVDKNSTHGVEIQVHPPEFEPSEPWYAPAGIQKRTVYIGFENMEDALFFKIKYSV
jgi:hypothetical protein